MVLKKILVIQLRAFGDAVLLSAPLLELSRIFPQASIDLVLEEAWAPIFESFPQVRKIRTFKKPKPIYSALSHLATLAAQLRREKYDCVINFHASPTSALIARASGSPIRSIHFHGLTDSNRFSTVSIPGKGEIKPITERNMDTLRALGLKISEGLLPKVFLSPSELSESEQSFQDFSSPILGLHLGASRPTKRWPVDRFALLAMEWVDKMNGSVLCFLGPGEEGFPFLKALEDWKAPLSVRAKIKLISLPLRKLAGALTQVSVLATSDSGPKHLAVAVGTPTVTFFGPEDPFEWHPYRGREHAYLTIPNLPCRKSPREGLPPWCGLHECLTEKHRCMTEIGVEDALAKCLEVAK